jgi:hypothetical protein
MWKDSDFKIFTLNGVTSKKKIVRDQIKEDVLSDIIVEFNVSEEKFSAYAEDFEETFDMISQKVKNTPRYIGSKKKSDSYFKSYAESKAFVAGYKIEEDPYWIKREFVVSELISNRRVAARIFHTEHGYDCYVFYKNMRYDDNIRFKEESLEEAKEICVDKANAMGWRIDYE